MCVERKIIEPVSGIQYNSVLFAASFREKEFTVYANVVRSQWSSLSISNAYIQFKVENVLSCFCSLSPIVVCVHCKSHTTSKQK